MVSDPPSRSPVGREPPGPEQEALSACREVVTEFFHLVDSGWASHTLGLFTEDGKMTMGSTVLEGEALASAMRGRETDGVRRVHFPTESVFRLVDPEHAEVVTLLQLFVLDEQSRPPLPRALTRLVDRFVRGQDRTWRIEHRLVTVLAGSE